jgi:hypothetical protein
VTKISPLKIALARKKSNSPVLEYNEDRITLCYADTLEKAKRKLMLSSSVYLGGFIS